MGATLPAAGQALPRPAAASAPCWGVSTGGTRSAACWARSRSSVADRAARPARHRGRRRAAEPRSPAAGALVAGSAGWQHRRPAPAGPAPAASPRPRVEAPAGRGRALRRRPARLRGGVVPLPPALRDRHRPRLRGDARDRAARHRARRPPGGTPPRPLAGPRRWLPVCGLAAAFVSAFATWLSTGSALPGGLPHVHRRGADAGWPCPPARCRERCSRCSARRCSARPATTCARPRPSPSRTPWAAWWERRSGLPAAPVAGHGGLVLRARLVYVVAAALCLERPVGPRLRLGLLAAGAPAVVLLALFPFGLMANHHLKRCSLDRPHGPAGGRARGAHRDDPVPAQRLPRRAGAVTAWSPTASRCRARTTCRQRYMRLLRVLGARTASGPGARCSSATGSATPPHALTESRVAALDRRRRHLPRRPRLASVPYPPPGGAPLQDPRVRVHVEDGRFFLQSTRAAVRPHHRRAAAAEVAGVVSLYTQEYFAARCGGVWRRAASSPTGCPSTSCRGRDAAVVRGFCAAFADCSLWNAVGPRLDARRHGGPARARGRRALRRRPGATRCSPSSCATSASTRPELLGTTSWPTRTSCASGPAPAWRCGTTTRSGCPTRPAGSPRRTCASWTRTRRASVSGRAAGSRPSGRRTCARAPRPPSAGRPTSTRSCWSRTPGRCPALHTWKRRCGPRSGRRSRPGCWAPRRGSSPSSSACAQRGRPSRCPPRSWPRAASSGAIARRRTHSSRRPRSRSRAGGWAQLRALNALLAGDRERARRLADEAGVAGDPEFAEWAARLGSPANGAP